MTTIAERFASKVEYEPNTGCWLWNGHRNHHGYGLLWFPGDTAQRAHRVSWEIHRGPIPPKMNVLHHCDVTGCVNPDHLYLGDQRDNMLDRSRRGRTKTGHANTKLTAELVRQIRVSTEPASAWAQRLGMSATTINHARRGYHWKSVAMPEVQPRLDFPALRLVLSTLIKEPRTFSQIVEDTGLTRSAVRGHIHKGHIKGHLESFARGRIHRITQAGRDFLA